MAPVAFPLPRTMLPKLAQGPDTLNASKVTMKRLLEHTVREFETLVYARNGVVDATQWRALSKSQAIQIGQNDEQVTVYSERECGASSKDVAYILQTGTVDDSILTALTPSEVLMTGRAPGKLETVMYALGGAHTQQGLALFGGFMYDGIADCGVLHTIDGGDEETSCGFLGYKYVVKRSTKLTRHRHIVYLEYTGYTQSSNGERLGFHIEHSVDVPGFPDLYDRNSSRARQSVRYLFRQNSDRIVETFLMGNVELAVGGGDLFSISKLQQCAEIRRLTLMVRHRRERIEVLQTSSTHRSSECYLCHRTKRFFSSAMLAECDVCGQFVCSKCRNDKKLYVQDANGLMGTFQRAQTCKTCVLAASAGYAPPPMHMSVVEQVAKSQGIDKTSSAGRSSMSGRRHSSSSSSQASEHSNASSDFHSCRQGPVYTFEDKSDGYRHWRPKEMQLSTAPALSVSISKGRGRSGTSSSNSSAFSDDSGSARRGIYLTPPNPRKLYEEQQRRHGRNNLHRRETTSQLVVRNNSQTYKTTDRQHARTAFNHGDRPRHELANPYSNSYSGPSSTTSIVARTRFPQFPYSERGFQRTTSMPAASGRSDLIAQMMELNMKAECTYNATQRNGNLIKHQIQTRQRT
ncbi:hypothetical protein P3T76_016221 [Phytophthora citrophthora]|uniref:FYVE-type domain-containing protein n=1 Tax=Phytophthora citrophthora TaxID=4793 RepID=A0AAD9LAK4_9STRA|nr:hypothetical protein P3T76_016221 [Phytophthora citrophthora]